MAMFLNPIALRKAKIVYNFYLSECSGVKPCVHLHFTAKYFCILKDNMHSLFDITVQSVLVATSMKQAIV